MLLIIEDEARMARDAYERAFARALLKSTLIFLQRHIFLALGGILSPGRTRGPARGELAGILILPTRAPRVRVLFWKNNSRANPVSE